jgi:hypothetical protein
VHATISSLAVAALLVGCGPGSSDAKPPASPSTAPTPPTPPGTTQPSGATGSAVSTAAASTTSTTSTSPAPVGAPPGDTPGPSAASIAAAVPGECQSATTSTATTPAGGAAPTATLPPEPMERAAALSADVDRLIAYGCAHMDEWAGAQGEGGSIIGWFTGHVAEHEAALRPSLDHPDAVSFELGRYSAKELQAVHDEIWATMREPANAYRVRSVGRTLGAVTVALRADAHDLAEQLVARYGDRIGVRLGAQRFGVPHPGLGDLPCPSRPAGQVVDGLVAAVELPPEPVPSGGDFTGRVAVRNDGATTVRFDTGEPLTATVMDATGAVVATYDGDIAGVGRLVELAPGAEATMRVLGGTASCDPALGFALPPGVYSVVVVIPTSATSGTPTVDPAAGPIVAGTATLTIAS